MAGMTGQQGMLTPPWHLTPPVDFQKSVFVQFVQDLYLYPGHPKDLYFECPDWTFGNNCTNSCSCNRQNTKSCIAINGACLCKDGYVGNLCTMECQDGFFGAKCLSKCACPSNAFKVCDKKTGACTCKPGYIGTDCNTECNDGFHGDGCKRHCFCPTNADQVCNKENGTCTCLPGWVGSNCETECNDGFHGDGCKQHCSCPTNADQVCNKENGTCTCLPGWVGSNCETECQDGRYGNDCKNKCACPINAFSVCDKGTGQCTCLPGFGGKNCHEECDDWTFGSGCFGRCRCQVNETIKCDKETGMCICKEDFDGTNCSVYIEPGNELRTNYVVVGIGSAVGILTFIWIIVAAVCIFGHIRKRRLLSVEKYWPDSNNAQSRDTDTGEQSFGIYKNEAFDPDNEPASQASQASQGEPEYENAFITAHASGETQGNENVGSEKNIYEALNKSPDNHLYERFQKYGGR